MANAQLNKMLEKFGVVTVMDISIYNFVGNSRGEWDAIRTLNFYDDEEENDWVAKTPVATLDSLKIVNVNQDGPGKTAIGGIAADTLLKYGKTFAVEIQDALGSFAVMENLFGGLAKKDDGNITKIAFTDAFSAPKTLVGSTFYIDQETGAKQPIKIVFPKFLPDTVFNLQHDAEGDVSVFDINGTLQAFKFYGDGSIYEYGDDDITDEDDPRIGRYRPGADNEYYFIATEDAFKDIIDPEVEGEMEDPSNPGQTITFSEGYPGIKIQPLE